MTREILNTILQKYNLETVDNNTVFTNQNDYLKYNFFAEAKFFHIPQNFDFNIFIKMFENWFTDIKKFKFEIIENQDIKIIKYQEAKGIKSTFGISGSFCIFFYVHQNFLLYNIKNSDWLDNWNTKEAKFSFTKLIQNSGEEDISNYIGNYIIDNQFKDEEIKNYIDNNIYVENISLNEKIWFYCTKKQNEYLLAILEISSVKKLKSNIETSKTNTWKYILTSEKSLLVLLNEDKEIETITDLSNQIMTVQNEFGKDPVLVDENLWLSTRSNEKMYHDVKEFVETEKYSRISEIARLNWTNKIKDDASNQYAKEIYKELLNLRNDPFDEFSLFYMDIANIDRQEVISKFTNNEKLIEVIKKILANEDSDIKLVSWFQKWNISAIDSVALIQVLLKVAETNVEIMRILPFHKIVREQFVNKEKDIINKIIFDIDFCKHLIKCNQRSEAIAILELRLTELPDETLSDLLPENDLDLTGRASGQTLKICLFELLAFAHEKEKSVSTILQLTMLQPISINRLDKLIEISTSDLNTRATLLRQLLAPATISNANKDYQGEKYNSLDIKLIENKLKHPATRKGGSFATLQTWLATVKVPNFSMIRSYSEPLNAKNYQELNDIVNDIKIALNLENVETFIARGDKSIGITSFEAANPFLIIGGEHLTPDSQYYLTLSELKFAIGLELAHLFFKHSRLTATDVWQGAMEKSIFLVDTLLSVIPVVGIIGKSFGYIEKLKSFALLLQKTEKLKHITSTSQVVLNSTNQAVNVYKNVIKKDNIEKEQEFLAVSRLMQLTADRAGILFCGDMKSALRAIFLTTKKLAAQLPDVESEGLEKFILKQDSEGNFVNQELTLRIANLFAFYISDDYTLLRNELIKK